MIILSIQVEPYSGHGLVVKVESLEEAILQIPNYVRLGYHVFSVSGVMDVYINPRAQATKVLEESKPNVVKVIAPDADKPFK